MAGDWPNNDSQVTAIKAKTDNLPATPASQADAQAGATVPTADVTTNTNERDVVGNKTDAAVTVTGTTKTVIAYLKGIINRLPTSGTVALQTDATSGPTVPAADSTNNALASEVVGNKTDAAVTTVGTTKSLIAMLKGVLNRMPGSGTVSIVTDVTAGATVPTTDGTATANSRDVVGAKDDAAVTTVGTTKSIMAVVKGILNRMPTSGTVALSTDATTGPTVPATDSTNNIGVRDVVGSKADTKAGTGTAANSTLSLMAMLKGLWDLLRAITFSNLDATVSSRLASASFTQPYAVYDYQEFTANGTWSMPSGWSTCFSLIVMSGGGGAGSASGATGSGGGSGEAIQRWLKLSANQTVTIGAGGTGATNTIGGDGSSTTFGSLLTARGGGGAGATAGNASGGASVGTGIASPYLGSTGAAAAANTGPVGNGFGAFAIGGNFGKVGGSIPGSGFLGGTSSNSGSGAGGLFGTGGAAGDNSGTQDGGAASANTGAGGGGTASSGHAGGAGGSGKCQVYSWRLS